MFFIKITNNLVKVSINSTSNKEEQEKYTNISLYKKYIEIIIFNIKTKILYYFIANYIKFCNEFNNIRNDSIGDDNYGKLKNLIEFLGASKKPFDCLPPEPLRVDFLNFAFLPLFFGFPLHSVLFKISKTSLE